MNRQEELQQTREQLAEIERQIQTQTISEEAVRQAEQTQQEIRRQLQSDDGGFRSGSELDALLVTRVHLQDEIAAMTREIEETHPPVEVTASVRETQAPPVEKAAKKVGLLDSIGAWFRRTFGGGKKEPPTETHLTRRQRAALLKSEDEKQQRWQKERNAHPQFVTELIRSGYQVPYPEFRDLRQVPSDTLYGTFKRSGWIRKGSEDEKADEARTRSDFLAFMRELGNPAIFSGHEVPEVLSLNVAEYSQESLQTLLEHRDPASIRTFLQPLLQFDPNAVVKKYPLQKMTDTQRLEKLPTIHAEMHRLLGMTQWAEKFAMQIMPPDLLQDFNLAVARFNTVTMWAYNAALPVPFSFEEMAETDLRHINRLSGCEEQRPALRNTLERAETNLRKSPAVRMTSKELEDYGLGVTVLNSLTGIQAQVISEEGKEKTVYDVCLPVTLLEEVRDGKAETLFGLAAELETFSLITADGRPRLLGEESVEQLLRYGQEDLAYYMQMAQAGALVQAGGRKKDSPLQDLGPERVLRLKELALQAENLRRALSLRFSVPDGLIVHTRDARREKMKDPNWAMRKQFAELDSFEDKQQREKRAAQQLEKQRRAEAAKKRKSVNSAPLKARTTSVKDTPPQTQQRNLYQTPDVTGDEPLEELERKFATMEKEEKREEHGGGLDDSVLTMQMPPITATAPYAMRKSGTGDYSIDVPQLHTQNTGNGCWSVSLSILLRARGIELSQEQVRTFRPYMNAERLTNPADVREMQQLLHRLGTDSMNQILDVGDLVMNCLENTAVCQTDFDSHCTEAQLLDEIRRGMEDGSPVSILYGNHYRTIVGLTGTTIHYKNSAPGTPEDETFSMTVQDLADTLHRGGQQAQLTWLKKLDPTNTVASPGGEIVYVDGQLEDMRTGHTQLPHFNDGVLVDENVILDDVPPLFRSTYYPKTLH